MTFFATCPDLFSTITLDIKNYMLIDFYTTQATFQSGLSFKLSLPQRDLTSQSNDPKSVIPPSDFRDAMPMA